jgi:hypothetical protein
MREGLALLNLNFLIKDWPIESCNIKMSGQSVISLGHLGDMEEKKKKARTEKEVIDLKNEARDNASKYVVRVQGCRCNACNGAMAVDW